MTEPKQIHPQPKIYLDPSTMTTTNQTMLKKNYLAEFLTIQEQTNHALSDSVTSINDKLEDASSEQHTQYLHLLSKLQDQEMINEQFRGEVQLNELNNKEVIHRLNNLETISEEVSRILEEEKLMSQATIDQLSFQEDLTRKIHNKLEDYEKLYLDIQNKMKEQETFYQQINDKLEVQDMFHKTVMERMDKQDVNSQQMAKQLDSLRSMMIEKLESAIQSIETKYKQTLHYFSTIFSSKERVVHKFPINVDKKHSENEEVKKD
ncbi:hypothetical protein [Sutcliffiella halmapala]|uniref:hypothetical protein n=1 Tax=Sutcliffiella halmapala TaxID=79882 RepID=UPI0009954F08|nr:hypothetical protein [Sutcliffiella halmapala]